jgi:hypothetical protein
MWDMYGLEYCEDVTAAQQLKTWNVLQGKPSDVQIPNLLHLRLRAQINSQRHYEIYLIDAESGITAADITTMFESDPQQAADIIRQQGHCYHDGREQRQPVIV